ncbi:uncharacterized protein [Euwallacea fornicatus]|uniref:uncharacterized protein n=1 Tax=Euwallacea fornicatus TaxID=995702 RepID=UPI00338F724A
MESDSITREKTKTLFGYELTPRQNLLLNHLLPSVLASLLFIFIIAADIGVIFRHCKDDDPIWASLTLFCMYLPVIGSLIIILTDADYWPDPENMTRENCAWMMKKILGHLLFPVWSMWRFAERIFWTIEAAINTNDNQRLDEALGKLIEPRLIELYVFLQAYLHSLPQVLLQLHILMRHNSNIDKESKITQAFSILINLSKVAVTTTYYQRFKAQKFTGSEYPWLKSKKIMRSKMFGAKEPSEVDGQNLLLRRTISSQKRVIESRRNDEISRLYDIEPAIRAERRRSSDIYLEPDSLTEDDVVVRRQNTETHWERSISYISRMSTMLRNKVEPHLAVDGSSSTNFKIVRANYVKGLEEDDLAGRVTAFLWWFTFLLSRILAISAFAYFFFNVCVGLLISHVLIVIAALAYDVKTDKIKQDKFAFFIFIGIVYVFCIIEFKIRFKKVKWIYFGYFGLMYLENFVMCLVWYCKEIESLENDYWYRYIFYAIVTSHILSLSAMIFYYILTRPKSVFIRVAS